MRYLYPSACSSCLRWYMYTKNWLFSQILIVWNTKIAHKKKVENILYTYLWIYRERVREIWVFVLKVVNGEGWVFSNEYHLFPMNIVIFFTNRQIYLSHKLIVWLCESFFVFVVVLFCRYVYVHIQHRLY